MDEFRFFAKRPEETIASLVQRMQALKHALDRPEEMAVFKLLGAMPRALGDEVTRQLNATAMEPEEWTIELVGRVAIKIDRATTQANLWTSTMVTKAAPPRPASHVTYAQPAPARQGGRRPETSSSQGAQRRDSRTCHNCGEVGHIRPQCTKPIVVKGGSARTDAKSEPQCYHCSEFGHYAGSCPKKQAEVSKPGAAKMWCEYHKRDTHNTADCRATPRAKSARPAAARVAQAPAAASHSMPEPTLAQLKELWDAHHNPNAYNAAIIAPSANVAPVHSRLTRKAVTKDERLKGPLSNMPLSFIPKDFLREPQRPPPGMMTVPEGMVPVLEAQPNVTRDAPEGIHTIAVPAEDSTETVRTQAPLTSSDAPAPEPNLTELSDLPASFTELPVDSELRQGMVYEPSVPRPALTPEEETAPTRRGKPRAALAVSQDLYDSENPNLSALLSHLPGSYHSSTRQRGSIVRRASTTPGLSPRC